MAVLITATGKSVSATDAEITAGLATGDIVRLGAGIYRAKDVRTPEGEYETKPVKAKAKTVKPRKK